VQERRKEKRKGKKRRKGFGKEKKGKNKKEGRRKIGSLTLVSLSHRWRRKKKLSELRGATLSEGEISVNI
jgi:hypothetical protein